MIPIQEIRQGVWIKEENVFRQVDWAEDDFEYYESFEPIPLTPEILEKVKFGGTIFPSQISISDSGKYYWGNGINVEIKYLHQLQNLYFALTGTELEINLNP